MTTLRSFASFALALPALVLGLAACGSDTDSGPSTTGIVPEQLEAIEVGLASSENEVVFSGVLAITGAERDFNVEVLQIEGGTFSSTVHSPGMSDLSQLGGLSATLTLTASGLHGERSVVVTDEEGPVYVADVGHGVDADSLFGAGFVSYGETIGTATDESYDWEYTPVVFQSDEGPVSVEPGKTASITVLGASYRVAVIAAYKVTAHPDAALPCGGISDLLSYEVLRVASAAPAVEIVRPSDKQLAHLGCMAD